jgi:hypothetical protein
MTSKTTILRQLRRLEGKPLGDYYTSPAAEYADIVILCELDGSEAEEDMARQIDHIELRNVEGWFIAEINLQPEVSA